MLLVLSNLKKRVASHTVLLVQPMDPHRAEVVSNYQLMRLKFALPYKLVRADSKHCITMLYRVVCAEMHYAVHRCMCRCLVVSEPFESPGFPWLPGDQIPAVLL